MLTMARLIWQDLAVKTTFFWTYEEYVNNHVNKVKGKDVLKAKSQKGTNKQPQ